MSSVLSTRTSRIAIATVLAISVLAYGAYAFIASGCDPNRLPVWQMIPAAFTAFVAAGIIWMSIIWIVATVCDTVSDWIYRGRR